MFQDNYAGTEEIAVCGGSAATSGTKVRERHLYTSTGNELTLYVSRDHRLVMNKEPIPRVLVSYEGEFSQHRTNGLVHFML